MRLAHPTRFERVTSTFGEWRSIQLSYACFPILPSLTPAPRSTKSGRHRRLEAMTESNAVSIQLQSSSVIVSDGNSLMVWLPWPETWVRILWSLNSGTVMSWQNRPLLAVSSTFHDALSRSDFG